MERASVLALVYSAWNAKRPQDSRKNARLGDAAHADNFIRVHLIWDIRALRLTVRNFHYSRLFHELECGATLMLTTAHSINAIILYSITAFIF